MYNWAQNDLSSSRKKVVKQMKTVQFKSNDPKQKQFVAALRKNVSDYFNQKGISTKGNRLMFIKAILMLLIYITPFALLLTLPYNPSVAFLLVFVMGVGAHLTGRFNILSYITHSRTFMGMIRILKPRRHWDYANMLRSENFTAFNLFMRMCFTG